MATWQQQVAVSRAVRRQKLTMIGPELQLVQSRLQLRTCQSYMISLLCKILVRFWMRHIPKLLQCKTPTFSAIRSIRGTAFSLERYIYESRARARAK